MYICNLKPRGVIAILFVSSVFSVFAYADDATVSSGLQQAQALYAQRNASNLQPTNDAIAILEKLEGQADDPNLNYDVLILESRTDYWNGEHTASNSDKQAIFLAGQAKADAAKGLVDAYAEAYYYAGINLARWAEAKGILQSLSKKQDLIDDMNGAISRVQRDGQSSGENIDGDGPNRVFGIMYFKLPGILGGSHEKSVQYLRKAIADCDAAGFRVALNVVYLAQTLSTGNSSEKNEAKQLLDDLLKSDPATYNPARIPENMDEFAEAKQLRAQL